MASHRALQQAYETVSRPVVEICRMAHREPLGVAPALNAHERHAEAAGLIRWCEHNLSPLQMAYVRIYYGGDERGLELLEHYMEAALAPWRYGREGIRTLIRGYASEGKVGLREIRRDIGCGIMKAIAYRTLTYGILDDLHVQVMRKLKRR